MKVTYLEKGERRPRDEKTLMIVCRPGLRRESAETTASGPVMTIRTDDLKGALAKLRKKGAAKVYVRVHDKA